MDDNDKKHSINKRIILMIIAIIIIILALLTSCSCTSKFFGKIGSLFMNEGNFLYEGNEGDYCKYGMYCETIINQNLKFDQDSLQISLSDSGAKLSYSYYGINPKDFTCSTSDASIATCYVNSNGYVVINPKNEGTVIVTLQTVENDNIYQATATVTIGEISKGIYLQQNSGTINLYYTNKKVVVYSLLNINGKVNVTSSNEDIATASAFDGMLKITAHKTGKVTITLKVESAGATYEVTYQLTVINKANEIDVEPSKPDVNVDSDSTLSNLTTNKGAVLPSFNPTIKDYIINISQSDKDITVTATPNSNKASVIYKLGDISNTTGYFDNLKPGKNIINITITAEDGTISIYTLCVNKPDNGSEEPDPVFEKSKLISLTTNKGEVIPSFNPDKYEGYKININDYNIDIDAVASSGATIFYTYGSITNETGIFNDLKPGENIIVITVKESGKTEQKYVVTVITPSNYEIKFRNNFYECNYEDKTCKIVYEVKKDNFSLPSFNLDDIKLEIIEGTFKGVGPILGTVNKNELGLIFLTPDTSSIQDPIKLKITYTHDGKIYTDETTITFKTKDYYVNVGSNDYDMDLGEERTVIIYDNLFSNDSDEERKQILQDIEIIANNKGFKLVSKHDPNIWLEVSTTSDLIKSLKLTLNLDKFDDLSSLALLIDAKTSGDAVINITSNAYGKTINKTITMHIYKTYKVILSAGDGVFNTLTKEYDFKISNKESESIIDLSKYDEPYLLIPGDECYTYKFLGFASIKDPTKILYSIDGVNYPNVIDIKDIMEDTTFIAVYDKDPINKEPKPSKTDYLWLVDVPLFYNKEYHDKYNIDKIIYPGAKGSYTMHIGNATNNAIKIVEMILEEETICVDTNRDGKNDGCLNMGYIIKTGNRINDDYQGDYLYGNYKNSKYEYQILHNDDNVTEKIDYSTGKDTSHRYIYRNTINVRDKQSLTVLPNTSEENGLELTIHWEWVDFDDDGLNDRIDTAIGNYAAEQNENNKTTINDLYSLKVGLKLEVESENTCP